MFAIRLQYILLLLFGLIVMVDPTNKVFHLKEVAFFAFMLFSVLIRKYAFPKSILNDVFKIWGCAILSLVMGLTIFGSNLVGAESYLKALLFLILVIPLSPIKPSVILKANFYIGLALSVIIAILYFGWTMGIGTIGGYATQLEETDSTIMIAWRETLGIQMLMFFYKTMPFCLFALIYALRHRYYLTILPIAFAIIIGATRTPILMGMAIIGYVFATSNKKLVKYVISVTVTVSLYYLLSMLLTESASNSGDSIKFDTMTELLSNSSIVGHGVGCLYKSTARSEFVTNSEMTYFEMIYQYGWILSIIVIWILVKPIKTIRSFTKSVDIRDFAFAYLCYLVNAGTNPLLMNSTGMYVIVCALVIADYCRKNNKINGYSYDSNPPRNLQFR